MSTYRFLVSAGALILATMTGEAFAQTRGLQSRDLLRLRSVGEVKYSPDGSRIAYSVINNDGDRRPYSQLWIITVADGKSIKLGGDKDNASNAEWSADGHWIAYDGNLDNKSGLIVSRPDGSNAKFLSPLQGTNNPLPSTGRSIAWSPDGRNARTWRMRTSSTARWRSSFARSNNQCAVSQFKISHPLQAKADGQPSQAG